jgi:ribosomal protein S18 acetylase RimI-like enzyme
MQRLAITPAHDLEPDERREVAALLALVAARDGAEPAVHTAPPPADAPLDAAHFSLARSGRELVGVASLVGYQELEVTGVVHPDHRRRGIGRALVAATRAEIARRGPEQWLLVCDAALPGGAAFAAAMGGTSDFSEHRLRLDPARLPAPAPTSALAIRLATPADTDDLAALLSAAFGDPVEDVRGWVGNDFGQPDRRWFIASLALAPIGTLRVREGEEGGEVYVTGFGIAPAYQNQRLGRQFLLAILAQLRAEGRDTILIEVETNNAPANALYRAVGFEPIRTFAYYRMGV